VRKLFRRKFSGEEGSVDKVAAPEFSEECEKTVQESGYSLKQIKMTLCINIAYLERE
jgi:hypothetical protein